MSSPVQESDCSTLPAADLDTAQNNEPGADSDSDSDSDKSVPETHQRSTLFLKMMIFCKELTIMVLLGVIYAALTNESPPKVSKSPAAYPFFPRDSLITDWYKGQITQAIEEARSSDIAFVMFYAPWDAECQHIRKELELTAQYMHEKVTFAAVNCWQPGSECRRQYSKVYKWPVLIAYPTHGRGIQYNGPYEAFHMIKFLQNMCNLIDRSENVEDLMGKHNNVVSAQIDVSPGSFEYAVFYSAALRFLEKDPFRSTVFAVFSQNYDAVPSIHLYNWNGTLTYDGEWNPESLMTWIMSNSHYLTGWVAPTGMKSLTLSTVLQPGPTLVLFTPVNPLLEDIDYYDMLREVAYDYYNCANSDPQITRILKLVREERKKNRASYHRMKNRCLKRHARETVITNVANIWANTTLKNICGCEHTESRYTACPEIDTTLTPQDRLSPSQLQKTVIEDKCRDFLLAEKYATPLFERLDSEEGGVNLTGLGCVGNATLKFVAFDSLRLYQYAERLGVDLSNVEDNSGAVIINEKMETHHVMAANVSSTNLRSFIYNFTQENLSRSLRSKINLKVDSHHLYPHLNCSKSSYFCVTELTSRNFLDTILQKNKVVVVFYYSKQCSFCNGFGYIFLTVAKLLATVDDIIFARIDGEANLLPWQYTMESYPTILFLPANGKSESRTFPKNLPLTVPNILGFLLTNVDPVLKLKTMWSICCQTKFVDEKRQCLTSLRMETLTIIGKTLKEWRKSTHRPKVLYKLQMLKHLHWLFAHSPEKNGQIRNYLNKLRG